MLTFFTISSEFATSVMSIAGDIFTDMSDIWILVLGVGLALIIFEVIIHAIKR